MKFKRNYTRSQERRKIQKQYSEKVLRNLQKIKGLPFWIEDPIVHEQLWHHNAKKCCFNHVVGLPWKDGRAHPIYDYEIELCKYLDHYKHLWIKKARGLGITEFFLRYMGWLALSTDLYRGKRFVVIPGTRAKISWDLIRRLKHMFRNYILEDTRLDLIVLNGVTIEAFPSNPEAIRGYEDYKFIMLDEADYFDASDQEELMPAIRGFIPKTNPWIVMVSTPHEPNSLFHRIEQMRTDEEAGFKRLHYLYERGLGKIYDPKLIEEVKKQPDFKREYEGQYSYGVGTLFSESSVLECERLGREIDGRLSTFPIYQRPSVRSATRKSLGIDIGWGSSRTAFVLTEWVENKIRVVTCEQYDRPNHDAMVRRAYDLIRDHELDNGTNKVFIDGSFPSYIEAIKRRIGENKDYLDIVHKAKASDTDPMYLMNIVPINFSQKNQSMLDNAKKIVDRKMLAINPDTSQGHKDLLTDLRIAKNKPESLKLDKSSENKMDLFDALRLALEYYE